MVSKSNFLLWHSQVKGCIWSSALAMCCACYFFHQMDSCHISFFISKLFVFGTKGPPFLSIRRMSKLPTSLSDLHAKSLVQRSLGSRTITSDGPPPASTTSPRQGLYVD
jgi:hypothetical protein